MGWDLFGVKGFPVVETAAQCSTGFDRQDSETHGRDPLLFISKKGRNVDTIAEMDWEEGQPV